ncbi:hypothetical protein [Klebsiella pneumoniae]|uniref:hypothetical protein n=1 Tax=Klebsiella pneumoniae TaxID=573 RepID=UPI00210BF630|nr:hypothetical protein [Klebsiella pneumoniae]MCQ3841670.1 hypothetical protein [Klebsiella pneumoniae]
MLAIIHSLFSLWSGVLSTKYVFSRAIQEFASTSEKWIPRRRPPGQTGSVVHQFKNMPMLRFRDEKDAS